MAMSEPIEGCPQEDKPIRERAWTDGQMAESSEVFIVQDEVGLPIYCASYAQACHEHIDDAINEHGIEEARAWKVLRYSNYVLAPCHKCNSTRIATAVPHGDKA